MDVRAFYMAQSATTDPGEGAGLLNGLTANIQAVARAVGGAVVALDRLQQGESPIPMPRVRRDLETGSAAAMLAHIAEMDAGVLLQAREPQNRIVGLCTHFAILTCSLLRHLGVPARVRCGFETYYSPWAHHDHSICEYWSGGEERWLRMDTEMATDAQTRAAAGFDPLDVPNEAFVTGAETWLRCRQRELDPGCFGIMGSTWLGGWDFVLNAHVHDILALTKSEMLPGASTPLIERGCARLQPDELRLLDHAAELIALGDIRLKELLDLRARNACLSP